MRDPCPSPRIMGILLLGLVWASAGCGYTVGYRPPPGVKTVAVPIFTNATFPLQRNVEFELTSAFRKEIQERTDLTIVDERSRPDMVVRGRIVEFRESVVVEGRRDEKIESSLVATVDLDVENYKDGTLRHLGPITDSEPISIQAGESFETGRRRAIRNLAEKLMLWLEDWGDTPVLEAPR